MDRPAPADPAPCRAALLELFFVFFRISALTIGGGYVMFPIMKREVVDSRGWITHEELVDYYAMGQSVPGIIAINTSTLIGYRQRGLPGAVAAVLGIIAPSLAVILLIAAFLTHHFDRPWVQKAFAGVRAAVVALIGMAVWQVGTRAVRSWTAALLMVASFLAIVLLNCTPVLPIVAGGLIGTLVFRRREKA